MPLDKKVIGNAMSAYFMVFVSVLFLFSKNPRVNHPFVKSHVKSAFFLHSLLFLMLFIMSFSFLDGVKIFEYSVNTIITALLGLFLFGAMLYGVLQAHREKTVTLGEIFHTAGAPTHILQNTQAEQIDEEQTLLLILAHIPFVGYIISAQHKNLPHMRDINMFNLMITGISVLLAIFGSISLASIIMLGYIIWSVFVSIRLIFQNEVMTLDTSKIPTPEEKYNIQRAFIVYIQNTYKKTSFTPLKKLIEEKTHARREEEIKNLAIQKQKSNAPFPDFVFYIPIINIIGIFFLTTRESFHIKNGFVISILFIIGIILFQWDSPILLLVLFPVFYGIGYNNRKAYKMPYIYDIYAFFANIFTGIFRIFHTTRKLQKTEKIETIKIQSSAEKK